MAIDYATVRLRWEIAPPEGQIEGLEAAVRINIAKELGDALESAGDLMFHQVPVTEGKDRWDGPLVLVGPDGDGFVLSYLEKPEFFEFTPKTGPLAGKTVQMPKAAADSDDE